MIKLTLEDKEKNIKFYLFDSMKINDIYFKEFNLFKFNILTDVELISENITEYINIENFLILYKDNKNELKDIFDYILLNDFNFFAIKDLEEIMFLFFKKKSIKEMINFLKENIVLLDKDINENDIKENDKYYFHWLKRLIQTKLMDDLKYEEAIKDNNFEKIFGSSIKEMRLKINIKKENNILKNEYCEALIVNINEIKGVINEWMKN